MAAYFVVKSFSLLVGKKRIVLVATLIFVTIPGMFSSSLFYYAEGQLKSTIGNNELAALNFIGKNLPLNSSVIAFTSDSESKLETFAGVNQLQILQTWDYLFLNDDPSMLLYLLGTSNAKYVYLSRNDAEVLNQSNNALSSLLEYLPVAFQNSNVTIYEVPQVAPPSLQSNFTILNLLESDTSAFENVISDSELAMQMALGLLKFNYTISSISAENNITSFTIEGLNSSDWVTSEGIGAPFLNEKEYFDGSATIAVNNLTTDKSGYFAIGNKCPISLTQFDSLQVPLKVSDDVQGEVKFILRGSNNTFDAWLLQNFPKNQWFRMMVPLTKPTLESITPLDLGDIREIDIGFQGLYPNKTYSFLRIGNVSGVISSPFLPYDEVDHLLSDSSTIMLTQDPSLDANSLIKLVEAGSKLVVFDTNDDNKGFFSNFLQLVAAGYVESNEIALPTSVKIHSTKVPFVSTNSSNVSYVSYYKSNGTSVAPFVLVKKLGLGTITYVILPSKIITVLEKPLMSLAAIVDEIATMQEFRIERSKYSSNALGSYNTLEGAINATGQIDIHTEHILNINPMASSRLEINTENTSTILTNATVDSLKVYGSVQLIIAEGSISLRANSASSYVTIVSDGFNQSCLLELSDGAVADLSISNASGPLNFQIKGGSLLLDTLELNILVRNPSIKVQGDTYFESARIEYANPYVPLAGATREPLRINGNATFTLAFTTDDIMLITSFSYDGIASLGQLQSGARFDIPWLNFLLSPISFVFYLVLLVFAVFLLVRKQLSGNSR